MSFLDTLILQDSIGTDLAQFNLRQKDLGLTERIDTESTLAQPRVLQTKHQQGKGPKAVDRHWVTIAHTLIDPSTSLPFMMTTTLSLNIPRTPLFTDQLIRQNIILLTAYLGDSYTGLNVSTENLRALLRGES